MKMTPRGISAARSLDDAHHRLSMVPSAAFHLMKCASAPAATDVFSTVGDVRIAALLVVAFEAPGGGGQPRRHHLLRGCCCGRGR